ncbi:hypothetical protein ABMA28_003319 [Loxostege sticticalis]|uniref:Uncharacterized protein n=1 Tax=Loxostege sticticalis TaxID=481309 RepID=A0ABD0SVP4_LOXSC
MEMEGDSFLSGKKKTNIFPSQKLKHNATTTTTYDEWESVVNKDSGTIKKTTQDCATCTEKLTKDNFTNTEKMLEEVEERVPTIVDIHGCKYFGQFVSNELLRFSVD